MFHTDKAANNIINPIKYLEALVIRYYGKDLDKYAFSMISHCIHMSLPNSNSFIQNVSINFLSELYPKLLDSSVMSYSLRLRAYLLDTRKYTDCKNCVYNEDRLMLEAASAALLYLAIKCGAKHNDDIHLYSQYSELKNNYEGTEYFEVFDEGIRKNLIDEEEMDKLVYTANLMKIIKALFVDVGQKFSLDLTTLLIEGRGFNKGEQLFVTGSQAKPATRRRMQIYFHECDKTPKIRALRKPKDAGSFASAVSPVGCSSLVQRPKAELGSFVYCKLSEASLRQIEEIPGIDYEIISVRDVRRIWDDKITGDSSVDAHCYDEEMRRSLTSPNPIDVEGLVSDASNCDTSEDCSSGGNDSEYAIDFQKIYISSEREEKKRRLFR